MKHCGLYSKPRGGPIHLLSDGRSDGPAINGVELYPSDFRSLDPRLKVCLCLRFMRTVSMLRHGHTGGQGAQFFFRSRIAPPCLPSKVREVLGTP